MKILAFCLAFLLSGATAAATIDGYPPATTPLSGTERLVGNQGVDGCAGCTRKITTQSIANLVTIASLGLTNVVYGPTSSLDNGIARFDGITGKIIQGGSGILVNDLSGTAASIQTAAGNSLSVSTTSPAAITTAQVGPAYSISAANAVAGSSVAGAAAGGGITLTAGNAARLTSGDANGGNITLTTGSGIGAGTAGQVNIGNDGSSTLPALSIGTDTTTGWYRSSGSTWTYLAGGVNRVSLNNTILRLGSSGTFAWSSSTSISASDTAVARNAAGVIEINNGTAGTYRDLFVRNINVDPSATGTASAPALYMGGDTATGWYRSGANQWTFTAASSGRLTIAAGILGVANNTVFGWPSAGASTNSADSGLARNGAGIVEINNGTAGQFRDLKARAIYAGASNLLISGTAPTIASGLCTSPSVSAQNGTAAFALTVGSACAGSTGTLTMPAATTGWVCHFENVTNNAANVLGQTGGTTTSVTFTNYSRTTGAASNFTASDSIRVMCSAY